MSITDCLRWLTAPDRSRWKSMLLGLGVFAVAVETAVLLKPPDLVTAALMVIGIGAWFAGACSMVGYVRWFFASEMIQAKQDRAGTFDKENDVTPR